MVIGKVVGMVVATRKHEQLVGSKFLIIQPTKNTGTNPFVAIDSLGAGVGEVVLVSFGSAARMGCGNEHAPVDAMVIGIIDGKDNQ